MSRGNAFAALEVEDSGAFSEDDMPLSPSRKTDNVTSPSSKKAKARKRQQDRAVKVATHAVPEEPSHTFAEVAHSEPAASAPLMDLDDAPAQVNGDATAEQAAKPVTGTARSEVLDRDIPKANGVLPTVNGNVPAPQIIRSFSTASSAPETEDEAPFSARYDDSAFTTDAEDEADDRTQLVQPGTPKPSDAKVPDLLTDRIRRGSSATVTSDTPKSPVRTSPRLPSTQEAPQDHGSDHAPGKKKKAVIERTIWTLVMVSGFFIILYLGHIPMIALIFFCQTAVFRELAVLFDAGTKANEEKVSPARRERRERRDRWARVTSWYFFAVTNYFLYGETIIYYFKHIVLIDAYFIPFVRHHRLISIMLWIVGFVGFVSSLNRTMLRRQFGLFCWIHMSLFLILGSSHFIVNNVLEGMIWLWVPSSLVIMNDVAAYCCGMLFGRHQLIKLSPKKTVEGFVGALLITVGFAYVWASIFQRFPFMICPARELGVTASANIQCEANQVFQWHELPLPGFLSQWLSTLLQRNITTLPWTEFQLHSLVLGIFASLVAPFGGFFASGFKRAYNIKDFGDSIPGHGGLTDRFDCQFMMGMFTYFYYASFCRPEIATVTGVFERATTMLDKEQLAELVSRLQVFLKHA